MYLNCIELLYITVYYWHVYSGVMLLWCFWHCTEFYENVMMYFWHVILNTPAQSHRTVLSRLCWEVLRKKLFLISDFIKRGVVWAPFIGSLAPCCHCVLESITKYWGYKNDAITMYMYLVKSRYLVAYFSSLYLESNALNKSSVGWYCVESPIIIGRIWTHIF